MKNKKQRKKYKTPKVYTNKKKVNPPTIISMDVYSIEDTKLLSNLNIFPLIIKGKFTDKFFTIGENEYYILYEQEYLLDKEVYACLNIHAFLKNFEVESEVRLLLNGRDNPIIHHGRLINGDIILCTDLYNIPLSKIIEDTIYMYGTPLEETSKIKTKKQEKY